MSLNSCRTWLNDMPRPIAAASHTRTIPVLILLCSRSKLYERLRQQDEPERDPG